MMRAKVLLVPSFATLRAGAASFPPKQVSCREALCHLFLALERAHVETPKVPLNKLLDAQQTEYLDFRKALCEAYHNERINQAQALEAAVQALSTRMIAHEPGVREAMDQARLALLAEVK